MASQSRTPAVTRAAQILQVIARAARPTTASAIAHEVGIPRTSVIRICESLSTERWLVRGRQGTYWIGPQVATLAASARLSSHHGLTYAMLLPNLTNTYYDALLATAESDVAQAGGHLTVRDAGNKAAEQKKQWREALGAGTDVILVDAVEGAGYGELVEASRQEGIPVVAIGTRIDSVDAAVTSDNVEAGLLSGNALLHRVPDDGKVGIIGGLHKNANTERIMGFIEALRHYPNVTRVGPMDGGTDDEAWGRHATDALLSRHPDVDGIFAVCDPVALGAVRTLDAYGRHVPITAVDGLREVVEMIRVGGPVIATTAQDPEALARKALQIARELHDGTSPQQHILAQPVTLITEDNARRCNS